MSCSIQIDRRREFMPHAQQIAREIFLFLPVEARRGLVEQHQPRLGGKRPREADELLHAVGQVADDLLAVGLELEELDDLLDLLALLQLPRPAAPEEQAGAEQAVVAARVPAEQQVLQRGELRKQLVVLEGARDAALGRACARARS